MTNVKRIRATGEVVAIAAVLALLIAVVLTVVRGPQPAADARSATGALPPVTRAALDAGNAAFRGKQYALALGHYRLAANSSPGEAAPYFGIYMAAQALHDTALADSALTSIRARTGGTGAFNDTTLQALHAKR